MSPSADEGKKIAEKGAATIRNVVDKAEEVAGKARRAGKENYLMAAEALRQFNLKFLQPARENSEATFEFLTDIINAKDIQAAGNCGRSTRSDNRNYGVGRLGKSRTSAKRLRAKAWIRSRRTSIGRWEQ